MSGALLVAAGIAAAAVNRRADLVQLQWAGSADKAAAVVNGGYGRFRGALSLDRWALIPAYTLGLVLAGELGRRVFWGRGRRFAAKTGIAVAFVAGLCNLAQDQVLLRTLSHRPIRGSWEFQAAIALSFLKFSLLIVAAAVGVIALATTASRMVRHIHTRKGWETAMSAARGVRPGAPDDVDLVIAPPPTEWEKGQVPKNLQPSAVWWTEEGRSAPPSSHWSQDSSAPTGSRKGLGIAVSGGGIRSACVALGALQALQAAPPVVGGPADCELSRADYLVSVSGGGYTACAYQQTLRAGVLIGGSPGQPVPGSPTPKDVFAPGSPEEDHLRRHSDYLADTAGEWLAFLGVVFRCLAFAVVLIGLAVTVAGLAIGNFYRYVPVIPGGPASLRPRFLAPALLPDGTEPPAPGWPGIPLGVTVAVLAVLFVAVVAFLFQLSPTLKLAKHAARVAKVVMTFVGLLAAIGIVVPLLIWLSARLSWTVKFRVPAAATTGSLTVVISYLGALAGMLWRKRTTVTKQLGAVQSFFRRSPGGQVLPNSMVQLVLLWICLIVVVVGALVASGWVATSGLVHSWWALLPVGVLAVCAIFFDETWLSAYPFYRQRLSSAFSVRRHDKDQLPAARRMGDAAERIRDARAHPLSTWGERVEHFPETRFLAAANITGQDRTPPARRAVSFALSGQWVGGPQSGWVRTDFLEKLVAKRIGRDLDIQAARSISGAAFAAAMGAQTRFFEVFLALTNIRLGAWLPNPYFVALKTRHRTDWTVPGLPDRRRLDHWAREIFGIHPSSARMLLCTDGGHYENLGLMELLRLRCEQIYCFDASSGGAVPLADTLAGVLALAQEELGARVTLNDPYDLVPGCAKPFPCSADAPMSGLNARISTVAVITAKIEYEDHSEGKMIFAQAALTRDMPYELINFARNNAGFPRDSTADQWFDSGQFDSYQQLGRYIGDQAVSAARGYF